MSSDADDILFERRGVAGLVTLNRPKALNAVTHGMVRALRRQLDAWADDGAVTRVIVMANGERAFSAGGDIRALYDQGKAGQQEEALAVLRARNIRSTTAIKRYPKPYVSLIDGIVMGGGVGISIHGSHRVAGDRYQFAMPEVGIGFFPDVGATWALPRLPGKIGTYLALTGERIKDRRRRCGRRCDPSCALGPFCRSARCAVRRGAGRCGARRFRRAARRRAT